MNVVPKETLFSWLWRKTHKENLPPPPPYHCYYSLLTIISKPIRKWFSAVLIPTIPFSNLRVQCYRWCGYKIGKILSSECVAIWMICVTTK